MNQALKKLPPRLFILNYYLYPIIAGITVVVVGSLLIRNGFTLPGIAFLLGLCVILIGIWWMLHPRQSKNLPADPMTILIDKTSPSYTLLAFESAYCPVCMTMGKQTHILEQMQINTLKIYHLDVNTEPGKALFRRFEGRVTPTYILLDPEGNLVTDWPVVLPVQRIAYAVTHQQSWV